MGPAGLGCCVQHHVGVGGLVVNRGIEGQASAFLKGVADVLVFTHPLAQFDD